YPRGCVELLLLRGFCSIGGPHADGGFVCLARVGRRRGFLRGLLGASDGDAHGEKRRERKKRGTKLRHANASGAHNVADKMPLERQCVEESSGLAPPRLFTLVLDGRS